MGLFAILSPPISSAVSLSNLQTDQELSTIQIVTASLAWMESGSTWYTGSFICVCLASVPPLFPHPALQPGYPYSLAHSMSLLDCLSAEYQHMLCSDESHTSAGKPLFLFLLYITLHLFPFLGGKVLHFHSVLWHNTNTCYKDGISAFCHMALTPFLKALVRRAILTHSVTTPRPSTASLLLCSSDDYYPWLPDSSTPIEGHDICFDARSETVLCLHHFVRAMLFYLLDGVSCKHLSRILPCPFLDLLTYWIPVLPSIVHGSAS